MSMNKVIVNLSGCDDTTPIHIEVTNEELAFLEKLERLSKEESSYGCMPVLEVEKV